MMISTAKSIPPIGALNDAAIPPAAPAAMSARFCSSLRANARPRVDPTEPPICTIGPSRPPAAPVPSDVAAATSLPRVTEGRIRPPCRAIDSMTWATPPPRASGSQ
jgi:hypothetical protein